MGAVLSLCLGFFHVAKAKAINHYLRQQGIVPTAKNAYFLGSFIGFVAGMNVGLVLYYLLKSPVLSGLSMGVIGALSVI